MCTLNGHLVALVSAFKPCPRLRQAPPSGLMLLMVANVLRLSKVTHASLATRDGTCHPPLWGLVSPRIVEPSSSTKGSIKQKMVQNALGPVHESLHTTCLKIRHIWIIFALGGPRGHTKDWLVTLESGPSSSALRGAVATVGGGGRLVSAFKRRLRLRQPPLPPGWWY